MVVEVGVALTWRTTNEDIDRPDRARDLSFCPGRYVAVFAVERVLHETCDDIGAREVGTVHGHGVVIEIDRKCDFDS